MTQLGGRSESEDRDAADELRDANHQLLLAGLHAQERADEAQGAAADLNALLESLSEAVTVVEPSGRVVLMNPAARALYGHSLASERGSAAQTVAPVERHDLDGFLLPEVDWPVNRALRGERFDDAESLLVRSNGEQRRAVARGSAIRDGENRVTLAIIVERDVTALRQLEQLKADYLALISHDLRNPLTVVQGQADLLHRELLAEGAPPNATAIERTEAILRNARRMNAMIEDLLDSSRLESDHVRLSKQLTDLSNLVREVRESIGTPEDQARVQIASASGTLFVSIDAGQIERAIANLVTNALKYSPLTAAVVVRVERVDDEAVITVADSGSGIPLQERARIFERFAQVGKELQAEAVGLGLGLYIARLIVEAHEGRIWVESEEGQGSTFSIALPLDDPDGSAPHGHA